MRYENAKSLFLLKRKLAERDGGWFCHYCGRRLYPMAIDAYELAEFVNYKIFYRFSLLDNELVASADHIVPTSEGGRDDIDNRVLSCQFCNSSKGRKSYPEFIYYMFVHPEKFASRIGRHRP